jgi:hydrogenase nickel incorporation protein HypA/HybF
MHEMSLAEGILRIIEDQSRTFSFDRVRTVFLEIGALANVEIEALRFAFEAVTRDSVADGAGLEIETLPGEGWCLECIRSVPLAAMYAACPQCGGYQVRVTGGTEMRVKELAVD